MKELSVEEKAKAYDRALERARKELQVYGSTDCDATRQIFRFLPELKESDDERIRKGLLYVIEHHPTLPTEEAEEYITWLKKQGEQKPTDKVEPKFHEGEWIVHHGTENIYQVVAVIDNQYQLKYGDNYTIQKCADVDRCARLWNITKDVKDGDVLATKAGGIFIYKELLYDKPFAYCGVDKFGVFKDCNCGNGLDWTPYLSNVTPATIEQRNLLFQKMEEAGYEFDFEKKKLKKIEESQDIKNQLMSDITNLAKDYITQESAEWSEEDKTIITNIIIMLKEGASLHFNKKDIAKSVDWLNSLKDRVQPKQKWKQENTGDLTDFESAMMYIGGSFFGENAGLDPNDTNVIKEQANLLLELVPKQDWSEEDEARIKNILSVLDVQVCWDGATGKKGNPYQKEIYWLKNIKYRNFARPQNQWKPSDEQMKFLWKYAEQNNCDGSILTSLYNDLKKLKG